MGSIQHFRLNWNLSAYPQHTHQQRMPDLFAAFSTTEITGPGRVSDMDSDMNAGYIPALPEDVAFKCLLRLPIHSHAKLQRVSRTWRNLFQSAEYYDQRKKEGTTSSYACMLQSLPGTNRNIVSEKHVTSRDVSFDPVYGVSVLDMQRQIWERLPSVPELSGGLPTFCKLVALKGRVVVLGGWLSSTWEPSRSVFLYSFSTQTWRRGSDMPSNRSFFACGVVGNKVFIAGGHDIEKKALATADVYDVDQDAWESLPSMSEERDESTGMTLDESFYVVSGYRTSAQGEFTKSAEFYHPATNTWRRIDNMWTMQSTDSEVASPGALASLSGNVYSFDGKAIVSYSFSKHAWTVVDKIPEGEKGEMTPTSIAAVSNSLVVTVLAKKSDEQTSRAMMYTPARGSGKGQWQSLSSNDKFLNVVQACCSLEI